MENTRLFPPARQREPLVDFELNLTTETIEHARIDEAIVVDPDMPLRMVLELLKERNMGSTLIERDGKLAGIFTERDALGLLARGCDLDAPIEHFMVTEPDTTQRTDSVAEVIRKMSEGKHRRLPVVDEEGKPTGVIKTSGIVHYLVEHFPQTIYNLPPTPNQATEQREGA